MNISQRWQQVMKIKSQYYRITVPTMTALCVISCFANCYILLAARWRSHRRYSSIFWMTLSLCGSGAWTCFNMALSFMLQSYLPFVHGVRLPYHMCFGLAFETIRMGAMFTTVLHLQALAINHFVGITKPLQCSIIFTPELTSKLIALLWIIPPCFLAAVFSLIPNQAFRSHHCQNVHFWSTFSFRLSICLLLVAPLLIMFLIYIRIYMIVLNRHRDRYLNVLSTHENTYQRRLKAAVTTSLYVGSFMVGWMPSVMLFVMVCKDGCPISPYGLLMYHTHKLMILGVFCNGLVIAKSLLDAFLYAIRVREIQLAMNVMHRMLCRCDVEINDVVEMSSFKTNEKCVRYRTGSTVKGTLKKRSSLSPNVEYRRCPLTPQSSVSMEPQAAVVRKSKSVCIIEQKSSVSSAELTEKLRNM